MSDNFSENNFKVLRSIKKNPNSSQREKKKIKNNNDKEF